MLRCTRQEKGQQILGANYDRLQDNGLYRKAKMAYSITLTSGKNCDKRTLKDVVANSREFTFVRLVMICVFFISLVVIAT